ncbi:MAG: hypothetical protein FH761_19330 [Firmicutes bacterium]|nr:hypothetical protein [Bacillota bacterium]
MSIIDRLFKYLCLGFMFLLILSVIFAFLLIGYGLFITYFVEMLVVIGVFISSIIFGFIICNVSFLNKLFKADDFYKRGE